MDANQKMVTKPHYKKVGNAGVEGTFYQINLLTIFLLNGLKISEEWYLSTENEAAGKFDDLVFESSEGNIFLQSKHKKNKKKKIGYEDLLSTNPKNDDFSLPKYFFSFVEIRDNFNIKNVIICTNNDLKVDASLKQHIKKHNLLGEDLLYFQGANSTIYTFNETILTALKQNIKTYYDENLQRKSIPRDVISDDNIEKFIKCLQFLVNYPSKGSLDVAVEKIISETELSKNLDSKMVYNFFYKKMQDWFKQDKGVYLTKAHVKAFFCEIRSSEYCNTLENLGVHFDNNDLPIADSNKKVWHIVPQEPYILTLLKLYDILQKNEKEFLLMAPDYSDDIKKSITDAFQVDPYVYLIIVCHGDSNDCFTEEICVKIKELLECSEYKKLILVSAEDHKLAENFKKSSIYEMVKEAIEFRHLNDKSKEKIKNKKNILFQGEEMCLSQLLSRYNEDDLSEFIDSESLGKFVLNEKIKVGAKVEALSDDIKDCYVNRTFNTMSRKIPEQKMWDFTTVTEKMILISDSPGMGKTTTLTHLAEKIKEESPYLWVIKLNINNYTNVLFEFREAGRQLITIPQLLDSQESTKLQTAFEKKLFSRPERVLLVIDGVDEISPSYKDIVVNLIQHCMENPSFVKIYVSTRPHLRHELAKKFTVQTMTLRPFSEQNQQDFLTRYWKKQLGFETPHQMKKCKVYAKHLIKQMLHWIKTWRRDMLAAVPLQTRIIAEVFQMKGNIHIDVDLGDWQGCREFLTSHEPYPRLPQKINLVKLYQLFLAKKKQIFIQDKGKSTGNVIATDGLKKLYDRCHLHHQLLALKEILIENGELLKYYWKHLHGRNFDEKNTLKLGIVQQVDRRYSFMHRTFAEFYVAECFVLELQCGYQNRPFQDFFLDNILMFSEYSVIRSFLNNFLGEQTIPEEVFKAYSLLDYTERLYNGDNTFLHVLTKEGCLHIVGFFLKCLSQTDTFENIDGIRDKFGKTLLHYACERGDMAQLLVGNRASVNVEDRYGNTPLHDAVSWNRRDVVTFLLDNGANVNARRRDKCTPLHMAVGHRNLEIVELLLANDANPHIADKDRNTALHLAAQRGNPNIIEVLVIHGADVHSMNQKGCTPLHVACKFSNLVVVKELVKNGSRVNDQNEEGSTALHVTARRGSIDILEYLIKNGADAAVTDRNGHMALHLAAEWGHLKVVKVLVKRGANVIARNKMGLTPLEKALSRGHLDVTEYLIREAAEMNVTGDYERSVVQSHDICLDATRNYLIENNVDINVRDEEGMTALHHAVRHRSRKRRIHYVKILVEASADVNIADNRGKISLHHAIEGGALDVVEYLLDNSADPNTTNYKDRTVLHLAAERGDAILLRFLLNTNVDVNAKDSDGCTALHYVCRKRNAPDLVEDFVRMGAHVNVEDINGCTPLHYALVWNGPIVMYLLRLGAKVDVRDANGAPPLFFAICSRNTNGVRLLLNNGVDPNAWCYSGDTALTKAVKWGNMDLIRVLVDGGAKVDASNLDGSTPLHKVYRPEVVELLAACGASVNARNAAGETPLHLAVQRQYASQYEYGQLVDTVRLLLEQGASVNGRDARGRTALHAAAKAGRVAIVRLLVEGGADVGVADEKGRTALDLAIGNQRIDVISYLQGRGEERTLPRENRMWLDSARTKTPLVRHAKCNAL